MSKELEALRRVVSEIDKYKLYGIGDENWLGIQDVLKDISTIENALQQAQKQEKLLERLYNVCKEYKHMSIGLSDDSDFINIMNDIEELENE